MCLSQSTQSRQGSSLVIWEWSTYRLWSEGVKPLTEGAVCRMWLMKLVGENQKVLPKVQTGLGWGLLFLIYWPDVHQEEQLLCFSSKYCPQNRKGSKRWEANSNKLLHRPKFFNPIEYLVPNSDIKESESWDLQGKNHLAIICVSSEVKWSCWRFFNLEAWTKDIQLVLVWVMLRMLKVRLHSVEVDEDAAKRNIWPEDFVAKDGNTAWNLEKILIWTSNNLKSLCLCCNWNVVLLVKQILNHLVQKESIIFQSVIETGIGSSFWASPSRTGRRFVLVEN